VPQVLCALAGRSACPILATRGRVVNRLPIIIIMSGRYPATAPPLADHNGKEGGSQGYPGSPNPFNVLNLCRLTYIWVSPVSGFGVLVGAKGPGVTVIEVF
jgi:hypothetical protein